MFPRVVMKIKEVFVKILNQCLLNSKDCVSALKKKNETVGVSYCFLMFAEGVRVLLIYIKYEHITHSQFDFSLTQTSLLSEFKQITKEFLSHC